MKKDTTKEPTVSFLDKFLNADHDGAYCYAVGGKIYQSSSRLNILCIAYPDFTPVIGRILDELGRFGGCHVFAKNYGASYFMTSGQIDLIVGYDLNAGEADWLGKCYDVARKAEAPLCPTFIVGQDCTAEDFREKFKAYMDKDFYTQRNLLKEQPSKERVRKLTDKEIGWKGKEFLCRLNLSRGVKSYLTSLNILDPKFPLKGTVRDLVYNFVMMVDGKPRFTESEEEDGEIKFIIEQLGYLPRTKINRGNLHVATNEFIDDETVTAIMEASAKAHNHSRKFFLRGGYVEMVETADPKNNPEDRSFLYTFKIESLQKLLKGEINPAIWFDDAKSSSFYSGGYGNDMKAPMKGPFIKDSIVYSWKKDSDVRTTIVDRNLLNLFISIEEALCIPHFAYEAFSNGMYGKESLIPLQQIA